MTGESLSSFRADASLEKSAPVEIPRWLYESPLIIGRVVAVQPVKCESFSLSGWLITVSLFRGLTGGNTGEMGDLQNRPRGMRGA